MKKNLLCLRLFAVLLLFFCLQIFVADTTAASEKTTKVYFYGANKEVLGTVDGVTYTGSYKGTSMKLPALPPKSGHTRLGWSVKAGSSTVEDQYKAGKTIPLAGKTLYFYAVYKKNVPVYFYDASGKKISSISKSYGGSKLAAPSLPVITGADALGWTTTKGSKTVVYKPGDSIPLKNTAIYLYPVYSYYHTVKFYTNDGLKLIGSKKVYDKGINLPCIRPDSEGYTFLGWSIYKSQKINKLTSGYYLPDVKLTTNKDLKLYAIISKNSSLANLTKSDLGLLNTTKYSRMIIIGDSRIVRLRDTLNCEFGASSYNKNVSFICESGLNLAGFQNDGYKKQLISNIKGKPGTKSKPIALVFALGANNLYVNPDRYDQGVRLNVDLVINNYINEMRTLSKELVPYNVKIFFVSVNPVSSRILYDRRKGVRKEDEIVKFNNSVYTAIQAYGIKYINTHDDMYSTGFAYDSGTKGLNSNISDGIHYSTRTSKLIYRYILRSVNKQ